MFLNLGPNATRLVILLALTGLTFLNASAETVVIYGATG